jgi:transposase
MSRYRLLPTPAQEAVLRDHCSHARYGWSLAVEQHGRWRPGRAGAPGYLEQCRQLTQARAEHRWLAAGTQMVQQQIPGPVPAPGNGRTVGIDRGVAVSAALSTGQMLHAPALTAQERIRLRRMQRTLARATRGSNRRGRAKHAIARLRARETDRRRDWAEKTSTDIARRFGVIRVEDLQIGNMTRSAKGTRENPGRNVRAKAGLNRGILGSGWGLLVRQLQDKAPGRVEKISPAFTSQRCSACGQVDRDSRQSQAVFRCTACGFACHADVNAARNIAAGHAVTARGGDGVTRPVNREPQLLLQSA